MVLTFESKVLPAATPIGNPIVVDSPDAGDTNTSTESQSIAADADGNFVVVWHQDSADGTNVMARRFNADGTAAGNAFVVNASAATDQRRPVVGMNTAGEFVIVWESGDDFAPRDIFARRYDANGVALGAGFRVHSDNQELNFLPEVAIDDDGSFAITWTKWAAAYPYDNDIFVRRFDAAGVPLGNEVEVATDVSTGSNIAFTSDGGFLLTWTDTAILYGRLYGNDGVPLDDPFAISMGPYADWSSIAVDANGGFVVAWQGLQYVHYQNTYARRFSSAGVALGDEFIVNSNPTINREHYPSVAMAADGNFVISWTGENPHLGLRDVFARTFNSDGVPLGDTFRVNPNTQGDQRFGFVAMTPTGEFIINWADGTDGDIYARRYVLNLAPTDVILSSNSVAENAISGTVVGILSSVDADTGDSFVFELVSGAGDDDNAAFQIVGNELRIIAAFDFETKASYSLRVRTTDLAGGSFVKTLTVHVTNVAETLEVSLSNSSVNENLPKGTLVGVLSLNDAPDGRLTFRLVDGNGDAGNRRFRISGNQLLTKTSFNFEWQSSYSVRVQAKDADGNLTIQEFAIEIKDVIEAPTGITLSDSIVTGNKRPGTPVGRLSAIGPNLQDRLNFTLVSGAVDNSLFRLRGNVLKTDARFDGAVHSTYTVRIRATDEDGLWFEEDFTITVT